MLRIDRKDYKIVSFKKNIPPLKKQTAKIYNYICSYSAHDLFIRQFAKYDKARFWK